MGTPTRFHSKTTGLGGAVFDKHSMLEVLQEAAGGGRFQTLGRYVVTALLNAAAGYTPFLSETMIRRMWNDLMTQGYFEPTAGVRWGPTELSAYLRSTMR